MMQTVNLMTLDEAINARVAELERKEADALKLKKIRDEHIERQMAVWKVELIKRIAADFGVEISLTEARRWECQANLEGTSADIHSISVKMIMALGYIYVQASGDHVWLTWADIKGSAPLVYRAYLHSGDDSEFYAGADFIAAATYAALGKQA